MEYKNIANTLDLSYQEWLETRKSYIGGSDAGAIVGVNPWSSPAKIWLSKQEDAEPIKDNLAMKIGRDLEDYVARLFTEETGKKVRRNNFMMVNKKYPFMMANVDREVVGENAVLECKTTGSFSKDQWEDGQIPPHYYCQVQHYMATTGYDKGYIAVLIGNQDFKWYEIPRDEEYIEYLIKAEKDFYDNQMVLGAFPEPDGSNSYSEALKAKYSQSNGCEVELDGYDLDVQHYLTLKRNKKQIEEDIRLIEQKIQLAMEDNEVALAGDKKITWKTYIRNSFDKKSLEKDYPEIAEKYYIQSDYKRFQIK